jgi:DNA-binding NarL/FixJ family response regulator
MSVRIVLAADESVMRPALRALLAGQDGLEAVGEASDGSEAARLAAELAPDVVVVDVGVLGPHAVDAMRRIAHAGPGVKVVALSVHSGPKCVAQMLKAGASGYVLEEDAVDKLVEAIREVAAGRGFLSPTVANEVVEDYVRRLRETNGSPRPKLTSREREVLQLIAAGHTSKQAAQVLHVSRRTIDAHRRNIMAKLGIDSIAGLTKYAIREGLTTLDG